MHWIVQTMNIFKSHVNLYLSRNFNIFFKNTFYWFTTFKMGFFDPFTRIDNVNKEDFPFSL